MKCDGWICVTFSSNSEDELEQPREIAPRIQPGRREESTRLDFGLIKEWLQICDKHHTTKCGRSTQSERRLVDLFLIDVRSRKLKKATLHDVYVALSYVWGAGRSHLHDTWKWDTTREMVNDDSFSVPLPENLPRTVEDAITCTLGIGQQYLWIDAFYINQHDPEHLADQIDNMGLIYLCATVTIIALDGANGQAGLSGISRPMKQMFQPRLATNLGTLLATHILGANLSEWDRRAWTMQEYILSRRRIPIGRNHVSWSCYEESLHNCLPVDHSNDRFRFEKNYEFSWDSCDKIDVNEGKWYFTTFADVLALYSSRVQSFEPDALNACRGMLNHITRDTGMRWVQGLPRDHLLPSLLWTPHSKHYLTRRPEFPSWSWLGWLGRVIYTPWLYEGEGPMRIIVLSSDSGERIYERTPCPVHQKTAFAAALKKGPELTPSTIHQELGICDIPLQGLGFEQSELRISSTVAKVKLHLVRTHDQKVEDWSDTSWQNERAVGDHWTLLDKHNRTLSDPLGEYLGFEQTDYLFRLGPEVSRLVLDLNTEAQLVFIKFYDVIRDSEWYNNWATNVVTAPVLLPQSDGKMMRIASVAIPLEYWLQTCPEVATVCVV